VKAPLALVGLALAAGCSKRTDPGSGSGTLLAAIEIAGSEAATSIDVALTLGGNPVAGANVVFTDADTNQVLTLEQSHAGSYRGTLSRYHRTLKVKITSGDDTLAAELEGPSPHIITRPPNDSIVRRGSFTNLRVEWQAESHADRALVEAEGAAPIPLDNDPFEANVPLADLKDKEQKISVGRETSVDLAGGAKGSKMTSRYKVDNRFTLEG
jgi:hypothetical protein